MTEATERYVLQIMWHLTPLCNLRCLHCYEPTEPLEHTEPELVPVVADQIRDLAEEYDIIRVGLLGGEPLISQEILFSAIEALKTAGVRRVDVGTNGTLIDKPLAKKLATAGITMVQISFEGASPEVNDPIRGSGSFKRAIKGLKELQCAGVKTGVMVTVSKRNLDQLQPMLELALKQGIDVLAFNRFLPLGRGKKRLADSILSPEELKLIMDFVHEAQASFPQITVTSEDPLLHLEDGNLGCGGCGAGIANLAVLHDGKVYPCRRLPVTLGNIKKTTLRKIMSPNEGSFLHQLRSRANFEGSCGNCKHTWVCGGCRGAALAIAGNSLGSDPMCWLT